MEKYKEYTFKIEAFTIDTLPMARLAEYLDELAKMLGETSSVHFVRLEEGSVAMVHKIDFEAVPKVEERTREVKQGRGSVIEMKAYRQINKMLKQDNGTGALFQDNNVEIIQFLGQEESEEIRFPSVQQKGRIDGEIIRVGGSKEVVPVLMKVEGREMSGCHATRPIAKKLAKHLFENMRLYGLGRWERSDDGEWELKHFLVDDFEELQDSTLSKTVAALRELKGEWGDDSLYEILGSRHGNGEAN